MSTSNTVDYMPNSIGKSNVFDRRFNLDDPFQPEYKHNYANPVLLNTSELNNADIETITNKAIYRSKLNPNNLLNDPVLNKSISSDASIRTALLDDPLLIQPDPILLIDRSSVLPNDQTLLYRDYYNLKENYSSVPELNKLNNINPDPFWLHDFSILFRKDNFYKTIPTPGMSRVQILNSLTRFCIYLIILLLQFSKNPESIIIPIVGILIIIFIYYILKDDHKRALKKQNDLTQNNNLIYKNDDANGTDANPDECQRPTKGNPFMNLTVDQLMDDRTRPGACIATDQIINKEINENFDYDSFRDVNDVFDRGHAQRQFYTTPSTTFPNKQTDFARWLYKLPQTCKENQSNCLLYEDIRFNRFNPNIDRMNMAVDDLV